MQEKQSDSKTLQSCLNCGDNRVTVTKGLESGDATTEASADFDHAVPLKLAPKKHFLSKSSKIIEKADSSLVNNLASENTAEELSSEFYEKRNKSTMKVINMSSCIEAIVMSELQKSDSLPLEESSVLRILSRCSGPKGSDSSPCSLRKSSAYSRKENLVQPHFVGSTDRNNVSAVRWSEEKCLAECLADRGFLETQRNPSSGYLPPISVSSSGLHESGRLELSVQNLKAVASGDVTNPNQGSARICSDVAASHDIICGRWVDQQNFEPSFRLASALQLKKDSQIKPERNSEVQRFKVSEPSQLHSGMSFSTRNENYDDSVALLRNGHSDSSVRDAFLKARCLNPDSRFCSPDGFSNCSVISQARCPDAVKGVIFDGCLLNPYKNSSVTHGFTPAVSNSIHTPSQVAVASSATDWFPKQAVKEENFHSFPNLSNMHTVEFEKTDKLQRTEGKEMQEICTWQGFTETKNSLVGSLYSSSHQSDDGTALRKVQVTSEMPLDLSMKMESHLYAKAPCRSGEVSGCLKLPDFHDITTKYLLECKANVYEQNVGRAGQFQREDTRNESYRLQVSTQVNPQIVIDRQAECYDEDITKARANQHEYNSRSISYNKHDVGRNADYQQTVARQRTYQHPVDRLTGYQNEVLRDCGCQTAVCKHLPYQNESGGQKSFGNGREIGEFGIRKQASSVTLSSLETMRMNAWMSDMDYQAAYDKPGGTMPAMLSSLSSADLQKPQVRKNKNSVSYFIPNDHYSPYSYRNEESAWDGKRLQGVSLQGSIYHSRVIPRSDPSYIDPKSLTTTSEYKSSKRGAFELAQEISGARTHFSGYPPTLSSSDLASPIIPQLSPNIAPCAENRSTLQGTSGLRATASSLLGSYSPNDILHLQCRLCSSTYGSLRSFRMHFAKVHGQEPLPQHFTILTISEARSVLARYSKQEMGLPHLVQELYHQSGNEWTEAISSDSIAGLHTSQQKSSLDRNENLLAIARTKQIAEVYPMPARPSTASPEAKNEPGAAPGKMDLDNVDSSVFSKDTSQSAGNVGSCPDSDGVRLPDRDLSVRENKQSDKLTAICSLCLERYENIEDWKFHSIHLMFPCKCKTCEISFVHVKALRKHVSVVHCDTPEMVVEYHCLFCWGHFATEDALYVHVSKEHEDMISQTLQGRSSTAVASKDCESFTESSQADTTSLEAVSDGYENLSTSERTTSSAVNKLYRVGESNLSICADQSKHPEHERRQNDDVIHPSSTTDAMNVPQKQVGIVEDETGVCLPEAHSQLMNLAPVSGCPLTAEYQQRNDESDAVFIETKSQAKVTDRYRNLSCTVVGCEAESKPFLLSKKVSLLCRFQNDKTSSCLTHATVEVKEELDIRGHGALKSKYCSLTEDSAGDLTSLDSSDKSNLENANLCQPHTLRHFLDALLVAEVRRTSSSPPAIASASCTSLQSLVSSKFFPADSVVPSSGTDSGSDMKDHDQLRATPSSSSSALQVTLQESAEEVLEMQVSKVSPSNMSASSQNELGFLNNRQFELAQKTGVLESLPARMEKLPKTSSCVPNPEAFSDLILSPELPPSDENSSRGRCLSDQLQPSEVASAVDLELQINAQELSVVNSHLQCKASNAVVNHQDFEFQNLSAGGAHAEGHDAADVLRFSMPESSCSYKNCVNTEGNRKQNVKVGKVESLNTLLYICHSQPKNCKTVVLKVQALDNDKNNSHGKDSDLLFSLSPESFPVESSLRSNVDGINLAESAAIEAGSKELSVHALRGQHGTSAIETVRLGSADISQSRSPLGSGTSHPLKRKHLTSDRELLGDDACDIETTYKRPFSWKGIEDEEQAKQSE